LEDLQIAIRRLSDLLSSVN